MYICDLCLRHFHHEWHVLSAVLAYQLHVVDQEGCSDQIDVVFPLLVHNLTSPLHKVPLLYLLSNVWPNKQTQVRLLTLRILILFKQPLMENSEDMEEVRVVYSCTSFEIIVYRKILPLVISLIYVLLQKRLNC